jgi:hypothetical protein
MCDYAARALLSSLQVRILESYEANAALKEMIAKTHLTIGETQKTIRRSDRLIRSLSEVFSHARKGR